ncbi:uncharacterized protein [Bactrocera oleae]|uniref:uncharacterized protein n=1 Tax=Bactrocera oleae TaxID=104688 RepID=UPI00387EB3DA
MFKSKTFRINHDIDKKPKVHELWYEPKRIRWIKFFTIPLVIAFSLLLVLSNVNFSGESYELTVPPSGERLTNVIQTPTKEVITAANIPMEQAKLVTIESDDEKQEGNGGVDTAVQYLNEAQAVATATGFQCKDNNTCKTLICSGGPIHMLQIEFEYFIDWCGNISFDVIIENCTFNKNTIERYTLSGNFKLSTLTIRNCTLDTILDNAFNYQSVNKLTNLTFVGVQLKALNAQTFFGLATVQYFKLFNVLKKDTLPLKANHFLQPMAASLNNLVLQQTEESCCSNTIYDPTEWLGGTSTTAYSKLLFVDLSGTNFNDKLNGNTFAKLSAVQELRLVNCSLSTIAEKVFNGILSTLKSLDLRYNQLQTLDGEFLATAITKGISIELGWNMWRCDCDNMEIIEGMKQVENNFAADTVCATPTELAGIQISSSQISCYNKTQLTTVITTVMSIAATTTTTKTFTDETTLATTESTPTTSTTITDNSTLMTSATMTGTDVSQSSDSTLVSRVDKTISATTPKATNIISTSIARTSTTVTPPASLMTSTIEDESTKERLEPLSTTTPQLIDTTNDNTTLIFFLGTTTIPIYNTETTKGTENTTINFPYTTVISSSMATIKPPMKTCFENKDPKYLTCSSTTAVKICDYDVTFNVVPISSRSVQLQIGSGAHSLQVIYFQVLNNSLNKEVEIDNNSKIVVDNLAPNRSYTFCLIPKNQTCTSPFNCRSAHLPQAQAWLKYNDVALFCTIAIFVTIVCAILGVAAIYFLLRWRPTLLYGNKRLRRIASTTHKVLLFPKPNCTSLDSKSELAKMHSSISDSLTPENYLSINSYDYMQYFKDNELKKQRRVAYISMNQPPLHRAPALPPNVGGAATHCYDRMSYTSEYIPIRPPSQQSTVVMEDTPQQQHIRRCAELTPEPEYESLDYYQELY